jgi:ribonuclease R
MYLDRCLGSTPSNRLMVAGEETLAPGDYVVAELSDNGARVVQRLAKGGSMLARIYAIAVANGLDPVFADGVAEEVAAFLNEPGIQDPELTDLRSIPFCTIDGPSTRDLDQALHVVATDAGFRLRYALADASWFVTPGSALFTEAVNRASSFYLPGLVIPMLPRELSEGLCSLNPDAERRALVMVLDLDPDGRVTDRRWLRARIRSRAKLAFGEVSSLLSDPALARREPGLSESLRAFRDLGMVLVARRQRDGVVRYRRDEVDLNITPGGRGLIPLRSIEDPVERWNEEVSVLCNTEGARWLTEGDTERDGIEPVYRVHPAPPRSAMQQLERRIAGIVALHKLDPEMWSWQLDGPSTLADYLDSLPTDGEAGRLAAVIHRQAVVTNLRSSFSADPGPHSGIGAEVYGRFTAPMREMVGIFLHKETIEKLAGRPPSTAADDLAIRTRVIEGGNRAKALQSRLVKEVNRLAIDTLFEADLALPEAERPRRTGTVMGIRGNRLYALLDELHLEVKVYLDDVADAAGAAVETDPDGIEIHVCADGRILVRLGERGRIHVRRFDQGRDRWVFGVEPEQDRSTNTGE